MPKITGFDVIHELKEQNPGIRIIITTGYLEPQVKSELFQAGVKDCIYKPYSVDDPRHLSSAACAGRPQDRKTTWRAFDAAIKKANENARQDAKLRRLTVHSLRHSFASIHLMNGTPIPEVSAMLGHANVNITLTVAAAIFSGDQVGHLKTAHTV